MIGIYRYSQIEKALAESFETRYKRKDVNITGILLARPETPVTSKEVLPHLPFWHYRSDYYTEFFCVGYTPDRPAEDPDAKSVVTIDSVPWYFSPKAFVEVVDAIESQTRWRYDSKTYLMVTNSRYDRATHKANLDFSGAIVVDLAAAVKEQAIGSVSQLADALFQFAKTINESTTDPVWEFSDQQGLRIVKRSLKDYLLELLPRQLKNPTRQAIHFVARDLTLGIA